MKLNFILKKLPVNTLPEVIISQKDGQIQPLSLQQRTCWSKEALKANNNSFKTKNYIVMISNS